MTARAATLALQRQEAPQGESLLALIKEDVACVQLRDPAARGPLESLLLYPDTVGGALEMLLDRIEFLEARLSHAQDCLRQLRETQEESERSAL